MALLQPLSDAVDRQQRDAQRARFRTEAAGTLVYYVAVTDKTSPASSSRRAPPGAPSERPDSPCACFG